MFRNNSDAKIYISNPISQLKLQRGKERNHGNKYNIMHLWACVHLARIRFFLTGWRHRYIIELCHIKIPTCDNQSQLNYFLIGSIAFQINFVSQIFLYKYIDFRKHLYSLWMTWVPLILKIGRLSRCGNLILCSRLFIFG